MEKLAARTRLAFTQAKNRAATIARTEVFGSLNFGRNTTIKETKYKKVQWFTAMDEKVRNSHAGMHGMVKGVYDAWMLPGGPVQFPADPGGPAGEVINCRCIEMVVLNSLQI